MSQTIDLNNLMQLEKLIKTMETNPKSVEGFLDRFPFHLLSEVSQLSFEVMCAIVNVLNYFMQYKGTFANANYVGLVMKFYYKSINFLLQNTDCDFSLLHKILNGFLNSFQRAFQFGFSYSITEALWCLIGEVVIKAQTIEILQIAVDLLCHFLHKHNLQLKDFNACAFNIWNATIAKPTRQKLAYSLICHPQNESIPIITDVHQFFINNMQLNEIDENLQKQNIRSILCTFRTCTDKNLLRQLSVKLINQNLHGLLGSNAQLEYSQMVYYEIGILFESTPWQGNLDVAINQCLIKHETREFSDLWFVMNYLDLLHNGRKGKDLRYAPELITQQLVLMYTNKIPTNPPVLKSIYLLFAAYACNEASVEALNLQTNLLLSLQHTHSLDNYLTYHHAQLIWILKRGSSILKNKVTYLWLQKDGINDKILAKCFEITKQQMMLASFIKHATEISCKRKVLNLLLMMKDSRTKVGNYLMKLLMKPNLTMDTVDVIMDGKPRILIVDNNNEANLSKAIILINACMHLLINFSSANDNRNKLKFKIGQYLYNMCLKLKSNVNICREIMDVRFVKFLIKEFDSDNEEIVLCSTKFLHFIITAQHHHKIEVLNQIPFDSYKIVNVHGCKDSQQTFWAIKLYNMMIQHERSSVRPLLKVTEHLGVYQNLLGVLISKYGFFVCNLLIYLMKIYERCATTVFNIWAIKIFTRQRTLDVNFIRFTLNWRAIVADKKYIPVPVPELSAYVKYLKTIDYQGIDYQSLQKLL